MNAPNPYELEKKLSELTLDDLKGNGADLAAEIINTLPEEVRV